MVTFNEEKHEYTSVHSDEIYVSATSLIHKYSQPFNKEYWSLYKALEELDYLFIKNKKIYLADRTYEYLLSVIPNYIDKQDLQEQVELILASWKDKNEISKVKGTLFHNKKERQALDSQQGYFDSQVIDVQDYKSSLKGLTLEQLKEYNYFDCLPDGYYTELLLFNHDYKIAGTSDIVIIETDSEGNRWVTIDDYKTNKEIKTENRFQNMKFPLNKIQDCNYFHYNLQTSLYGYMLECMGFKVKHTRITWINELGTEIPYLFEYRKTDIQNMLEHYKNNK